MPNYLSKGKKENAEPHMRNVSSLFFNKAKYFTKTLHFSVLLALILPLKEPSVAVKLLLKIDLEQQSQKSFTSKYEMSLKSSQNTPGSFYVQSKIIASQFRNSTHGKETFLSPSRND